MRYTKITVVGVAILLTGIASVAALSLLPEPEAAQPLPRPALETFYTPARYVNAATLGGPVEEPVQEFY